MSVIAFSSARSQRTNVFPSDCRGNTNLILTNTFQARIELLCRAIKVPQENARLSKCFVASAILYQTLNDWLKLNAEASRSVLCQWHPIRSLLGQTHSKAAELHPPE
jgi:hypothetical protein